MRRMGGSDGLGEELRQLSGGSIFGADSGVERFRRPWFVIKELGV